MARGLELRHLRNLVALAEERHFTRAAERVHLTQPALSQQIKALEDLVGVPLIDRTQRKVVFTDAGDVLLRGARTLLREAERTLAETRRAARTPRVALGYVEYAFQSVVSPILHTLLTQHPEVRIERREVPHDRIGQALLDRVIDLGFGMLPIDAPGVRTRALVHGRWQLVLPTTHPLAAHATLPLHTLAGENLLMFSRTMNPHLYDDVLGRFRRTGVEPNVVYETSQVEAGQHMVALGVGLWVVTTYVIADRLPDTLVARDLEGFDPITVGVAWRADESAAAIHDVLDATDRPFGTAGP